MNSLRNWLKSILFTQNTIRYRVEYRCLKDCLSITGSVQTLFDGGAAAGEMVRLLLRDGICKKAITLEYDSDLVAKLRTNLGRDKRVQIIHGSLTDVPLENESVDLAISTQVLEHIEDHILAASELARIVKKGGYILVSVPHPPERIPNPGHLREGYQEADLKKLFTEQEFVHLRTEYFLTLATQRRIIAAEELPLNGIYMPLPWIDQEKDLTNAQRREGLPYGIMCLFKKNP